MEIFRNIGGKLFGPSLSGVAEALIDVRTRGEFGEALRTPPIVEVLNQGNMEHKHALKFLPWDIKLGPDVTDFSEYTATFKSKVGCETCVYEAVVSKSALF